MPFKIIRNDITKVKADAIVNTANPKPVYASGTDAAIYKAAGAEQLLAERRKIGEIGRGQAAVTPAFSLPAQYIIHTVGPAWVDGKHDEFKTLSACYRNSLELAQDLGCKSIVFPLIATGVYGFPKDKALQTAVSEISRFLMDSDMLVILVVFDRKAFELSGKLFSDVDTFIDENYVSKRRKEEYPKPSVSESREYLELREIRRLRDADKSVPEDTSVAASLTLEECEELASLPRIKQLGSSGSKMNLDDALGNVGETFQQRLFF